MTEERAQPTDRMTSQPACYYENCEATPMWGIASSVEHKNPDGSPLTLYACEPHYVTLTNKMREVGTRYSLFPINGPHIVCGEPKPDEKPGMFPPPKSRLGRILFNGACIVVGIVIGPFIIFYYGGKWILGWRPPAEDQ